MNMEPSTAMMQRYYLEKAEYDKNIDQLNAWAEYTSSPEEVQSVKLWRDESGRIMSHEPRFEKIDENLTWKMEGMLSFHSSAL